MPPPKRKTNISQRPREYLTKNEVSKLLDTVKSMGYNSHRDYTLILMMYRHALRNEEAVTLKWNQINLIEKMIDVRRVKSGINSMQPLFTDEVEALKRMQITRDKSSEYLFRSNLDSKQHISTRRAHQIVYEAGKKAEMPFTVHPHMLRHATGYFMSNESNKNAFDIKSYMGHKDIKSTDIYVQVSPEKFKGMWN